MKKIGFLVPNAIIIILSFSQIASTVELFQCVARVDLKKVELKISAQSSGTSVEYKLNNISQLTKSVAINGLTGTEAINNRQIQFLMRNWNVNSQTLSMVWVYDINNYFDSGAGLLGVNFVDSRGHSIASGLILGWNEPSKCIIN